VYAIGNNTTGACGLGNSVPEATVATVVPVPNNAHIKSIDCGEQHTVLLDGTLVRFWSLLLNSNTCVYDYFFKISFQRVRQGQPLWLW